MLMTKTNAESLEMFARSEEPLYTRTRALEYVSAADVYYDCVDKLKFQRFFFIASRRSYRCSKRDAYLRGANAKEWTDLERYIIWSFALLPR